MKKVVRMPTSLLIRLPDDVASRFRSLVPSRQRNRFLADLVTKAVAEQEAGLEQIAAAVTQEENTSPDLREELALWESTLADGLEEIPPYEPAETR